MWKTDSLIPIPVARRSSCPHVTCHMKNSRRILKLLSQFKERAMEGLDGFILLLRRSLSHWYFYTDYRALHGYMLYFIIIGRSLSHLYSYSEYRPYMFTFCCPGISITLVHLHVYQAFRKKKQYWSINMYHINSNCCVNLYERSTSIGGTAVME